MHIRWIAMTAAAVALTWALPAQAQMTHYTLSGAGTGTMTLDYNGSDYSLVSLNLTLGSATFTQLDSVIYGPSTIGHDVALGTIGNADDVGCTFGYDGVAQGNTFCDFFDIDYIPNNTDVYYTNAGVSGQLYGKVLITLDDSVPEPAKWAMMLLGFGVIGAAARTQRKRRIAAA